MFGKIGDMMGKLHEMKKKADEIKSQLEKTILVAEAAGGDIKVRINGNRRVLDIIIAPALQHGDQVRLQEQLVVAMNRAIADADAAHETEMKKVAGDMLPGLM